MTSQDKFANKRPIFGVSKAANFVFKNRKKIFISLLVLILLGFGGSRIFAATGVPQIMSYQGRLTDSSGTLLGGTGTNYYFRFSIWDNATVGNGTRLWPSTAPASTTINVANGVFNVNIGDTAAGYPDVLNYNFMNSSDAFLQVEVSSDGVSFETLAPRQRIASTGFAINAGTLSGNLQASSTADFTFNVLNLNTGKASFNIATGSLLFGGTVRIDSVGQGTFTTSTITSLTVSGTSTFQGLLTYGSATGTSLFGSSLVFATGTFSFATTTNLNFTAATGTSLSIQNIFSTASTTIAPNGNLTMNFRTPYGAIFNIGSSSQVRFIATSSPTNDMVQIINSPATGINTAGASALQLTYYGSSTAGIEASGQRIDLTPGTGAGSTWNGLRIFATGTASGVTMNGIKIDALNGGVGGAGFERAIYIDLGWDTALAGAGGPAGRATSSYVRLGALLGTGSGANASGTYLSINQASQGSSSDFMNLQLSSSTIFKIASSGAVAIGTSTFGANQFRIAATGNQTDDQVLITNIGKPVATAGVSGLQISYYGGGLSGESSAERIDFTPPATGGGTWNGLRLVASGTPSTATTTLTGLKIDSIANNTQIGVGNENAIQIGTGWDNAIEILASPIGNTTTSLIQIGSSTIVGGSANGTVIGINYPSTNAPDFLNFQIASSSVFKVDSLGTTTLAGNLFLNGSLRIDNSGRATLGTTTVAGNLNVFGNFGVTGNTTFSSTSIGNFTATQSLTVPVLTSESGPGGQIFYNSTVGKFQIIENGITKQLCNNMDGGCATPTAAIAISGLMAATGSNAINNLNYSQAWNWTVTSTDAAGLTLGESAFSYASGTPSILKIATLASSTATGLIINNAGTSNALAVTNASGLSNFVIGNKGGVTVNSFTSDVVKDTTGSSTPTDFSIPGSTLQNVTSTNNSLSIADATIGNGGLGAFATSAQTLAGNAGPGSFTILRDDGDYIIVHASSSATASVWDGTSTNMSLMTVASAATVGPGAIALRRTDGRYLLVHGNNTNTSSVFDPFNNVAVANGPSVCGAPAATGTTAFQRDDGKYVILCGGTTTWGVYDPAAATAVGYTSGTAVSVAFGAGAHALHRDDGTFLVFAGGATSTEYLYNQYQNPWTGTMTPNPIASNAPIISAGAISVRQLDGKYLVIGGASASSTIYDPTAVGNATSGTFTPLQVGPSTSTTEGAQMLWRPDNKYLLILGNATTTTNLVDISSGAPVFTIGPSLPFLPGPGLNAFIRPDGQYMLVRANSASPTSTDVYNENTVLGGQATGTQLAYYETECVTSTALNLSSTLNWNTNSLGTIAFQIRTGTSCPLNGSTYKTIKNSGDPINPGYGDNKVQIKVFFQRAIPIFVDQEWGLRRGRSQTRYRRTNLDPVLYSVSVDNGTLYTKSQFDFGVNTMGTSTPTSSQPLVVNVQNDSNKNLTLANVSGGIGNVLDDTLNATNGGFYNGMVSTQPTTTVPTGNFGTVTMRRPDGKFVILIATTTNQPQLYDPVGMNFTSLGATPIATTSKGALAFKRPDGKFLVTLGGASSTTTIYDPVANTFTPGPNTTAPVGRGSLAIPLPTGRVLILHGNLSNTSSIYDPIQNYFYPGPTSSAVVGPGSFAIPRPNGQYYIGLGMATEVGTCTALGTVANIFDPYSMVITAAGAPALTGQGPGGFAFQKSDGNWVIVRGGATAGSCAGLTATNIYNPTTNQIGVGPVLSAAAQEGANAIQRADGTTLVVLGGATTATSIVLPSPPFVIGTSTAVAGPTLPVLANGGSISFPRDDGKYIIVNGFTSTSTATNTVTQYDAGTVINGIYQSEEINVPTLDSGSALVWQATLNGGTISAQVRTASTQAGLQTASLHSVSASGGLINPNPGDAWVQAYFTFARPVPRLGGIYADVWYNGGSAMPIPWVPFAQPTLNDFKITEDSNLINLQADGLSMFRVTANGDIFSSTGGSINTGGADLAERYLSSTPLAPGTVVSVDPMNNQGVVPTQYQYQPNMLGVVSTAPGFVAGAYTDNSYPIALVGRVPVLVSTENGNIKEGDRVTASSVSGYAMKATLSGRVLGVALESIDPSKLEDCPASQFNIPGRKCTTIMVFVNLVDYQGDSVDMAMEQWNQDKAAATASLGADNGLIVSTSSLASGTSASDGTPIDFSSVTGQTQTQDEKILSFLSELKKERETGMLSQSEIFTNRLSAVSEIISPNITANLLKSRTILGLSLISDTIQTKNLSADTISGNTPGGLSMSLLADGRLVMRGVPLLLSSSTNVISGLASAIDTIPTGISTSTGSNSSSTATSSIADVNTSSTASSSDIISTSTNPGPLDDSDIVISFDPQGNAFFAGELIAGTIKTSGLTVTGPAVFSNGLIVDKIGAPETALTIMSTSTTFFGRPYFNSDMGGFVVVTKGTKSVDVAFAEEYLNQPVVNASISLETQGEENAVFDNNMQFVITNKSTKGFTIIFNKPAPEDIKISWIALAITNAQTFFSSTSTSETTISTSSSAPVPSIFTPIVPSPDQPAQASSTDNSSTTPPAGTVPPNDSSTTPSQPTSTPPVIVNPESSSTNSSSSDQTSPAPTSSPDLTAPPQDSSPAPSPDVSSPPPSNPQPPADSGTPSGT